MRLGRRRVGSERRVGVVEDGRFHDLEAASVLEADPSGAGKGTPLEECELAAPVDPVRNVFCVGWNYVPHFEEGAEERGHRDLPDLPNFFTKASTTVTGPYDAIESHRGLTAELDWEVELAVLIGRGGRDIPEERALEHVFGYLVGQDVSARDLQRAHGSQWFKGKSLDGSCPLGPWVVTADQVPDPQALSMRCLVNGEVKQASDTGQMVFPVARLIAELSRGLTLLPGDVLLTGTPEGTGFARNPPEFLGPGDVLESEVEGIGRLRNPIV